MLFVCTLAVYSQRTQIQISCCNESTASDRAGGARVYSCFVGELGYRRVCSLTHPQAGLRGRCQQ